MTRKRRLTFLAATTACSALVLYEIDVPLIELVRHVGPEHARRAYAVARRSLDDLKKIVDHFNIACDFFSIENFRSRGLNKASDFPSPFTLVMDETSSRERKLRRSFCFNSPTISID